MAAIIRSASPLLWLTIWLTHLPWGRTEASGYACLGLV